MKLGLDIHGVIDKYPDKYAALARSVRANGGEVHIITGQSLTPGLLSNLKNLHMEWDYIVSIQDELQKVIIPCAFTEEDGLNRPLFIDEDWNSYKGYYCAAHHIDLMIDNSPEYRPYFSTPFLLA